MSKVRSTRFLSPLSDERLNRSASCPSIDRAGDVTSTGEADVITSPTLSQVSLNKLGSCYHVMAPPSSCVGTCRESDACRCDDLESCFDDVTSTSTSDLHNIRSRFTPSAAAALKAGNRHSWTNGRPSTAAAAAMPVTSLASSEFRQRINSSDTNLHRSSTPARETSINIGELPANLAGQLMRRDHAHLQRSKSEQKRARSKCLEWLNSLDSDDVSSDDSRLQSPKTST